MEQFCSFFYIIKVYISLISLVGVSASRGQGLFNKDGGSSTGRISTKSTLVLLVWNQEVALGHKKRLHMKPEYL